MGEMADFALEQVCTMESLRDDYVLGHMSSSEAYEHGFLDEIGFEQEGMQAAWDRNGIPTIGHLNNELKLCSKDLEISTLRSNNSRRKAKISKPKVTENQLKTIKFLLGFANHYLKYSSLSEKQMNIISTNFPATKSMCPVEHFCHHVDRNDLANKLDNLVNNHIIVDKV